MQLCLSACQQSLLEKLYFDGDEERSLDLLNLLEKTDMSDLVYTLIMHGEEDTAVPVLGTKNWVQKVTAKVGEEQLSEVLDLHIEPGAEHGFDSQVHFETEWLQEKLKKITEKWLGTTT
jgi:alpha-beta hydrolase superfamily lysophospholipase